MRYLEAFLGLVYPRVCAGCAKPVAAVTESSLCQECERELIPIVAPFCEVCGESFDAAAGGPFQCLNCEGRRFHFEFAVAGYRARGRARELIHRFKYRGEFHLCRVLGWMLEAALLDERIGSEEWVMVPVPLHSRRRREREYNQAAELCRMVRRRRGWRVVDALRRTRYTVPQARLDREDRLGNLDGAFELRPSKRRREAIRQRRIIVVDDVLTTGATTSECARVLKEEGGAERVIVLTVARG